MKSSKLSASNVRITKASVLSTPAHARAVAKAAFPEYTGRKIKTVAGKPVQIYNTYWGGGSKNSFVAVELATLRICPTPASISTPKELGGTGGDHTVIVPAGYAIVLHVIFCGRDLGCTVYLSADDAVDATAEIVGETAELPGLSVKQIEGVR